MKDPKIKTGRPRLEVNIPLLVSLRETEHFGWKSCAREYWKRTNCCISRDTLKRRYYEVEKKFRLDSVNFGFHP